jgi:hypothetical protein
MTRQTGGKAIIPRMFAIAAMLVLSAGQAAGADPGLAARCARVHDDDTVEGYVPALHEGFVKAFERLFPSASQPPDEREIQAGAHIRCMDGHLLACFTGANLPCSKMNAARDNRGADAFCRANPDAPAVPAFATGHDTIYQYRCVSGRADVTGTLLDLDRRGFAARLWTPLD